MKEHGVDTPPPFSARSFAGVQIQSFEKANTCLLYTSDAADE